MLPQKGRLLSQRRVRKPIVQVERGDELTQGHAPSPIPHLVDARVGAKEYVLERARHRTHSVLHKIWLLGERHQAEQKHLESSKGYVLVHEVRHGRIEPSRPSIPIPVDGGNQQRHLRRLLTPILDNLHAGPPRAAAVIEVVTRSTSRSRGRAPRCQLPYAARRAGGRGERKDRTKSHKDQVIR